jgi:hypothetical protein
MGHPVTALIAGLGAAWLVGILPIAVVSELRVLPRSICRAGGATAKRAVLSAEM